jgi:hypothetical protein
MQALGTGVLRFERLVAPPVEERADLVVPLVAPVALDPLERGNGEGLKTRLRVERGVKTGFGKGVW